MRPGIYLEDLFVRPAARGAGLGKGGHQPVPNPRFAPSHEAVVAGGVRPEPLGQLAPRPATAQNPQDAPHDAPVIHARNAPGLVRKLRGNDRPLGIGQIVVWYRPSPAMLRVCDGPVYNEFNGYWLS